MSRALRLKGRRGCLTAVSKLSGHLGGFIRVRLLGGEF
jgi:hypothetical protein